MQKILLIFGLTLMSLCNQKLNIAQYANGQKAFDKQENKTVFYDDQGNIRQTIDLKTRLLRNYDVASVLYLNSYKKIEETNAPFLFLYNKKVRTPIVEKRTYNELGLLQLMTENAPDDGGGAIGEKTAYQYNHYGQIIDKENTASWEYDELGRPIFFEEKEYCPKKQLHANCSFKIKYQGQEIEKITINNNQGQERTRTYVYQNNRAVQALEKTTDGNLQGVLHFQYNGNNQLSTIDYFNFDLVDEVIYHTQETFEYKDENLTRYERSKSYWDEDIEDAPLSEALDLKNTKSIAVYLEEQEKHQYIYEADQPIKQVSEIYDEYNDYVHQYETTFNYNEIGQMVEMKRLKNGSLDKQQTYLYE